MPYISPTRLRLYTVGSDIDHKVKAAAAQGEEAWDGMGEKPELRIWRIEKFQVKAWPLEQYGEFFKGDSYIGESCFASSG